MNAEVSENAGADMPFEIVSDDSTVQVSNTNQMSANISQLIRKALEARGHTWGKSDPIRITVMSDGELRFRKLPRITEA